MTPGERTRTNSREQEGWRSKERHVPGRWLEGIFAMAFGFMMLLPMQGCLQGCKPPRFEAVRAAFGASSAGTGEAAKPTHAVRVFVDCSGGMAGFLAAQSSGKPSNYYRVLSQLGESPEFQTDWYCLLGDAANPTKASSLLQASSYTGHRGSLAGILESLNKHDDPNSKTSTDVVVTDLAGAESIDTSGALGRALETLRSQGRQLTLWGFRSRYKGDYTPYTNACKSTKEALDLGQSLPGLGRPFYLLLSAPDRQSLTEASHSLAEKLVPAVEFMMSVPPVVVDDAVSPVEGKAGSESGASDGDNRLPKAIRMPVEMETERDWSSPSRRYSIFTVKGPVPVELTFHWNTQTPVDLKSNAVAADVEKLKSWPVSTPKSNAKSEAGVAKDGSNAITADDIKVALSLEGEGDPPMTYTVSIPAQAKNWNVYRLSYSTQSNVLPQWISDWNTSDDCDPSHGNRTLELEAIGEAMSSVFWKKRPFFEHYIAIRRKD